MYGAYMHAYILLPKTVRSILLLLLCCNFALPSFADTNDVTWFEYELASGRLTRKVYPDGKAITYTYHYGDLPKRITQASGKWMERFYDSRLNVTSNVYSSENTPDVHIVPNEFGTPLRVADTAGLVYEYGIRPMGQLLTNETVTSPWMDWTLGHSHDQFSRETGWTLSVDGEEKGTTDFNYGRNGKISQMTCVNAAGRAFTVNYTTACGYSYGYSIAMPGGVSFRQEVVRDPYRPELVTRLRNTAAGHVVFDCAYSYDALGRSVQRTDQLNASTDRYSYYRTGDLAAANISGTMYGAGYDSIGNCRWTSVGVITNYYQYNEVNQCLVKIRTGVDVREHTFDDDGNLTQVANEESYGWDCENRLITIETPNGSVTNSYDYEGRLVKQLLPDAVRYCVFDRWNLIYEKYVRSDNSVVEKQYFWGPDRSGTLDKACGVGGLVAVSVNGAFYFPCYGSNSEITAYVNESGNVVASYVYGPFGEVNLFTGPMVDEFAFRFMTKRYDTAAGLYDFGARWYSPSLHRWLNRDPIAERGGLNIYAFCCNDPINKFDPNGCAYFAKRALGGGRNGPISFGGNLTAFNDWLDRKNIELAHEQLFFQDGGMPSSVGYGKENLDGESMNGYVVTSGGYDDCVMRIAVEKVDPSPYSLLGSPFKKKYNCQDYADALREKYYEIRNSKEVRCKCLKRERWGR